MLAVCCPDDLLVCADCCAEDALPCADCCALDLLPDCCWALDDLLPDCCWAPDDLLPDWALERLWPPCPCADPDRDDEKPPLDAGLSCENPPPPP